MNILMLKWYPNSKCIRMIGTKLISIVDNICITTFRIIVNKAINVYKFENIHI